MQSANCMYATRTEMLGKAIWQLRIQQNHSVICHGPRWGSLQHSHKPGIAGGDGLVAPCHPPVSDFAVVKVKGAGGSAPSPAPICARPLAILWPPRLNLQSVILCPINAKLVGLEWYMGFAPTWLSQVTPPPCFTKPL